MVTRNREASLIVGATPPTFTFTVRQVDRSTSGEEALQIDSGECHSLELAKIAAEELARSFLCEVNTTVSEPVWKYDVPS
jgi:hypothetical protein